MLTRQGVSKPGCHFGTVGLSCHAYSNIVISCDCEIILTLKSRTRIKEWFVTHDIMYHNPLNMQVQVCKISVFATPLSKTCSIKPGYIK